MIITTEKDLKEYFSRIAKAKIIAFDFETTSLHHKTMTIEGLALCSEITEPAFVATKHFDAIKIRDYIKSLFSLDILFVAHNLYFDGKILKYFYGVYPKRVFDTMIASWYLDENSQKGLKYLSSALLGEELQEYKTIDSSDLTALGEYAKKDAEATLALYWLFSEQLGRDKQLEKLFFKVEMPFIEVLVDMLLRGIYVDEKYINEMYIYFVDKRIEIEVELKKMLGDINFNSPSQLSEKLYGIVVKRKKEKPTGKVSLSVTTLEGDYPKPPLLTASGAPSTADAALELLNTPAANLLQEYRKTVKLIDTYLVGYKKFIYSNILYPNFKHAGTVTGRLSSSEPNMQNISHEPEDGWWFRTAFKARPGYKLIVADESQIELRIIAHCSEDKKLVEAFMSGKDIHTKTASQFLNLDEDKVTSANRRFAKILNFSLMYGMSAVSLANKLSIPKENFFVTVEEAQELQDKYFDTYRGIEAFNNSVVNTVKRLGYIETIIGRKRRILGIHNPAEFHRAKRQAVNSLIQGSAADILKVAMIKIHQEFKSSGIDAHILLQIHDELVCEVKEEQADKAMEIIKKWMEHPLKKELLVPLVIEASICNDWGEAKK